MLCIKLSEKQKANTIIQVPVCLCIQIYKIMFYGVWYLLNIRIQNIIIVSVVLITVNELFILYNVATFDLIHHTTTDFLIQFM